MAGNSENQIQDLVTLVRKTAAIAAEDSYNKVCKDLISIWLHKNILPPVRDVYERNRADATSLLGEIRAVIDRFDECPHSNQASQEEALEALLRESEAMTQNLQAIQRAVQLKAVEGINDKLHDLHH